MRACQGASSGGKAQHVRLLCIIHSHSYTSSARQHGQHGVMSGSERRTRLRKRFVGSSQCYPNRTLYRSWSQQKCSIPLSRTEIQLSPGFHSLTLKHKSVLNASPALPNGTRKNHSVRPNRARDLKRRLIPKPTRQPDSVIDSNQRGQAVTRRGLPTGYRRVISPLAPLAI